LNWIDIVIIILFIIFTVSGLASGLIRSAFALAGVILGVVLASHFDNWATFIKNVNTAHIVAFIIVLLVVIIIATIVGAVISKLISMVMLGWLNHLLGAAFGLIFGGFIIGGLLTIWAKYGGDTSLITGSSLATFLLDRFPVVLGLFPYEFNSIKQFFQ
jgi:membrane protein required for colicin V production